MRTFLKCLPFLCIATLFACTNNPNENHYQSGIENAEKVIAYNTYPKEKKLYEELISFIKYCRDSEEKEKVTYKNASFGDVVIISSSFWHYRNPNSKDVPYTIFGEWTLKTCPKEKVNATFSAYIVEDLKNPNYDEFGNGYFTWAPARNLSNNHKNHIEDFQYNQTEPKPTIPNP